jgi:hypothetical protein
MKFFILSAIAICLNGPVFGQADSARIHLPKVSKPEASPIKINLSEDGSRYFQFTFLNQTWLRWNESNPGSTVEGEIKKHTFDIGLRRTRIQMFGQLTNRVFLYFQFGMNNFNSQFNVNSGTTGNNALNRKVASFFHDAVCEYKVLKNNAFFLGGGLTIANGLSRFSQPSIATIMTMDVPVFAQATVDATDEFSRKLSVFARGQAGPLDYRLILSDPFPVSSNGQNPITLDAQANFSRKGHQIQTQGFFQYQFFDRESGITPYMTGTYLGKKKIFNLAGGFIYQPRAMWKTGSTPADTVYQKMLLVSGEAFLDLPLNKEKGTAISAYAGYFNYDFGTRYMRFNGLMNPATGQAQPGDKISGSGPVYGNAHPMFGTGKAVYAQLGYLFSHDLLKENGTLMPYLSATWADWNRMDGKQVWVFNSGLNWLISGHRAKMTLNWENRLVYRQVDGRVQDAGRRNTLVLQYQIFI